MKLITLSRLAGLFHDFGKYSDRFQRMLETGTGTCQHSIHGAMLAYFGSGTGNGKAALNTIMASIAGHHAGLADWSDYGQKLSNSQFKAEMESLIPVAAGDSSVLAEQLANLGRDNDYVPQAGLRARYDLFIRMLFSCLVDADRLDSAGRKPNAGGLCAGLRLQALLKHIGNLSKVSGNQVVRQMRTRILDDCLSAAAGSNSGSAR
jgi:CRISPR-associated endonuclease/helicase Cas3